MSLEHIIILLHLRKSFPITTEDPVQQLNAPTISTKCKRLLLRAILLTVYLLAFPLFADSTC